MPDRDAATILVVDSLDRYLNDIFPIITAWEKAEDAAGSDAALQKVTELKRSLDYAANKLALMKPLRYKAVEQKTLSSP